jgi:hypothetical protein
MNMGLLGAFKKPKDEMNQAMRAMLVALAEAPYHSDESALLLIDHCKKWRNLTAVSGGRGR